MENPIKLLVRKSKGSQSQWKEALQKRIENYFDFQIKSYMQMLLRGTAYLHMNNIMHRDLKPANLLIR